MSKIGAILIGVLLGAFAVLEVCIGHTVGKGRHYYLGRDPVGFWCSVGFLVILAAFMFFCGFKKGNDDA